MGCWNETCFLTHLPIREGERAVFIPLHQIGDVPGSCYVNDCFIYAGVYMRGEYNDYGIIEAVDKSSSTALNLKFFKSDVKEGKIRLKDSSVKIKDTDSLISAIEREELTAASSNGKLFSHMLIHEGAFDLIIKEVGGRIPYSKTKDTRYYFKKELKTVTGDLLFHAGFLGDYFYNGIKWALALKDGTPELLNTLTDMYVFTTALSYLRRSLMPTSGKGSQCYEMGLHMELSEFSQKHFRKNVDEWRKDRRGDEEDVPFIETPYVSDDS